GRGPVPYLYRPGAITYRLAKEAGIAFLNSQPRAADLAARRRQIPARASPWKSGGRLYFLNLPPNVFVDIADCMKMAWSKGCGSGFILEPRQQIIIFECQHPKVRV